jgi:outer membrane protein assembly factor BamA
MRLRRLARGVFACWLLTAWAFGIECAQDHRADKKSGIVITDFTITGTQTLSSAEIAGITGEMIGSCYTEDADELEERIRALYQDRGYFAVEVKSVHLKVGDPLGIPKAVTMEADVSEGPQFRVGEITFVKNRAFSAERLRQEFPLKKGDVFSRTKVASGLESLRKVYGTSGYLDLTIVPETRPSSNGTMSLSLDVDEGVQYRLGSVEFVAKKELAQRLRMEWKLEVGAVYDNGYLDQYIEANRDLLPTEFTRESVKRSMDCPKAMVALRLIVDAAEDKEKAVEKSVDCEEKK